MEPGGVGAADAGGVVLPFLGGDSDVAVEAFTKKSAT